MADALPLVVFLLVVAVVIASVTITLSIPNPTRFGPRRIKIEFFVAPLIGALFVFAFAPSVDADTVWRGLKGDEHIQPYAIIILFQSLAYLCISLDITGLFAYIALRIAYAAQGLGRRLFLYYFLLSSALTVFTSNDIVILTLTPIICYFAAATGLEAFPFLLAEFYSANILSMVLFIGNPTNIIVAEAYELTFDGYSKWMAIPSIVAATTAFLLLYATFSRTIPERCTLPSINPENVLIDRRGAVFGATTLFCCLLTLVLSSHITIPLWGITLIYASVMFAYNFYTYYYLRYLAPGANFVAPAKSIALKPTRESNERKAETADANAALGSILHEDSLANTRDDEDDEDNYDGSSNANSGTGSNTDLFNFSTDSINLSSAFRRMPWDIVPFVFGMFVLVESLDAAGWIEEFAIILAGACHSVFSASFAIGWLSIIAANLINNQPMTILFTRILLHESFDVDEKNTSCFYVLADHGK
eukprot:TRINITY_DN3734_c0_g1_i1.p1 TRINITY_DN3734_c0_g1~~TRINITY_DN3734_c0_g1_i1.p1  ORF type:complete len:476 (+),score=111.56 TRINITY_DN3734_c0_g1_i1:48-1475(+)